MRVVLVCVFGMSTYYVVRAVEKTAKTRGLDVTLEAIPVAELEGRIGEFDLVLMGPQVRFKQDQVEAIAARAGKRVVPIPPEIYGIDGRRPGARPHPGQPVPGGAVR